MSQNNPKIIFFGTTEFAVPALEALAGNGYDIVAVVTTPDKFAGRKQLLTPPPVKTAAEKLNLKILQPEKLKDNREFLDTLHATLKPDIGIAASYGKIIPKEIIDSFPLGILIIHPSLLPEYRGPSPIQMAIINGDKKTGVTIIKIDEEIDHGPVIASQEVKIEDRESYQNLHDKLADIGAEMLVRILPDYLPGKITPTPQDHTKATFTKKFETQDGEITAEDTAVNAYNKIRALNPEPGTFITIKDKRLKILEAALAGSQKSDIAPGSLFIWDGSPALQLKNGSLTLEKVQLEGKKPISGKEFVGGYKNLFS